MIERPPHIDPVRWARAPWNAKKQLRDAYNRATAEANAREAEHIAQLRANVEAARIEHEKRYRPILEQPAHQNQPGESRAAQVEELTAAGMTPREIVTYLGFKAGSIAKALQRAGRHDLARPFNTLAWYERHHECADCPELVGDDAERCRRHAMIHRYASRRAA